MEHLSLFGREIIAYTELAAAFIENFENLVIYPFQHLSGNLFQLKTMLGMISITQSFSPHGGV